MTYATFILQLRNQVGDTRRRVHVDWVGDGTTTIFQMPVDTFPVLDQTGTYIVKVAASAKTEVADFTLDKEAGTLVLNAAPTNGQAVTLDSSAVHITNAGWLSIINSVIYSLGDDFWKEFVDVAGFTTTANMLSLSLVVTQPLCIALYEFQHREAATSNWRSVEEYTNWRYDRDNNIIYIGTRETFGITGQELRLRGLKKYTIGTAVTDSIDVQDQYFTILEYGSIARYWRWRYKNVVELVSKLSTENSRTPLQELIMLSDRFDRLYEIDKGKLKPQKPARIIPPYKQGGGRP
jgi:hypothetical protein